MRSKNTQNHKLVLLCLQIKLLGKQRRFDLLLEAQCRNVTKHNE